MFISRFKVKHSERYQQQLKQNIKNDCMAPNLKPFLSEDKQKTKQNKPNKQQK